MTGNINEKTVRFDAIADKINAGKNIVSRREICDLLTADGFGTDERRRVERRLLYAGWKVYGYEGLASNAASAFVVSPACTLKTAQKYCGKYGIDARDLFEYTSTKQDSDSRKFRDWAVIGKKFKTCPRQVTQLMSECVQRLSEMAIIDTDAIHSAMRAEGIFFGPKSTLKSRKQNILEHLRGKGYVSWQSRGKINKKLVHFWSRPSTSRQDAEEYCKKIGLEIDGLQLTTEETTRGPKPKECSPQKELIAKRNSIACAELMAAIFRYRAYCRAQVARV